MKSAEIIPGETSATRRFGPASDLGPQFFVPTAYVLAATVAKFAQALGSGSQSAFSTSAWAPGAQRPS